MYLHLAETRWHTYYTGHIQKHKTTGYLVGMSVKVLNTIYFLSKKWAYKVHKHKLIIKILFKEIVWN